MHKTQHDICMVMVTDGPHSGTLGYLSTKKHYNDLSEADIDEEKVEVNVVVSEVTENGIVIFAKANEEKKVPVKAVKRPRTVSISAADDVKIDGVMVKKKKVEGRLKSQRNLAKRQSVSP